MTHSRLTTMLGALALAAALAGCNETKNSGYQGWI
jgi:HlyD family secretion protein